MGISVTKLLIVLAIIIVIFGTKRLKNLGGDLGGAIKGFRSAMREEEAKDAAKNSEDTPIDGEVSSKKDDKQLMFEVGFSEICMVALVALLVIRAGKIA